VPTLARINRSKRTLLSGNERQILSLTIRAACHTLTGLTKVRAMLRKLVPLLVVISTPAFAIDRAYIGAWAEDPRKCNFSGSGPFRITEKGMEGHEFVCTTKRATSESAGLRVDLSCAQEDNTYNITLRWKITPNGHLRETTNEKVVEYVRCKPDDEAGGPQATQIPPGKGDAQGTANIALRKKVEQFLGADLPAEESKGIH
jgi:hypothetical protein